METRVRLYWKAVAPLEADYTIFAHLLDGQGRLIAQNDHQPPGGRYPTSLWDTDEQVIDESTLLIPASTLPGQYRLAVGMYLLATGERLTVDPPHNRVLLDQPIEVVASR